MAGDTRENVGNSLLSFTQQFCVLDELVTDNHQNNSGSGTKLVQICRRKDIRQMLTETYSHWRNAAEGSWREIIRLYNKKRVQKGVPKRLFTYPINWFWDTYNATALDIPELGGNTPLAQLLGKTDDMSQLLMHDFYDLFKYNLKTAGENLTHPKEDKDQIGRYLSLARNAAKVNTYFFLTRHGCVVTMTDVPPLSVERLQDPVVLKLIDTFNREIKCRWKLNDDADVQQAAPTFPVYESDQVPWENDEGIGPISDGPPDPDFFTPR